MRCPHCGHTQSRVIETRDSDDAVRRRRQCDACRLRFTTYERPQFPRLVVRTTNGVQRNFTRGWLAAALRAAGSDLPDPALKTLAAGIEAQLRATGRRVVATAEVAAVAAREAGQAPPALTGQPGGPTADQVKAALEASVRARRPAPSQLPLPIER